MFLNEDRFHFTKDELRMRGYKIRTFKSESHLYGWAEYNLVKTGICTPASVVYKNINGRIASCPTSFMNGWDRYVPLTLTLPKNNSEIRYFVECLKKLEENNLIWKNSVEQMNTYDYGKVYQLK